MTAAAAASRLVLRCTGFRFLSIAISARIRTRRDRFPPRHRLRWMAAWWGESSSPRVRAPAAGAEGRRPAPARGRGPREKGRVRLEPKRRLEWAGALPTCDGGRVSRAVSGAAFASASRDFRGRGEPCARAQLSILGGDASSGPRSERQPVSHRRRLSGRHRAEGAEASAARAGPAAPPRVRCPQPPRPPAWPGSATGSALPCPSTGWNPALGRAAPRSL
jgi:hypothetical protein